LLKNLGEQLKHLAFNVSSSDHAKEPMICIVRILRKYYKRQGLYVGVDVL
jgi:hypothetical protein